MIVTKGDLWTFQPPNGDKHLRVITTNGFVKTNGELVMGRGVAQQAKRKYPHLPKIFGELVNRHGNHVHILDEYQLASFPVKPNTWWENADINLIKQSALELRELTINSRWDYVIMPLVGCGNGKLDWKDVRPVLEAVFPEAMYFVVTI